MDFLLKIIEISGLPKERTQKELLAMIESQGFNPDSLTIENIREILATYMQETLLDLKSELDS